jgi:hypothetical protein
MSTVGWNTTADQIVWVKQQSISGVVLDFVVVGKSDLPGRLRNKDPDNIERLAEFQRLLQAEYDDLVTLVDLQAAGEADGFTDPAWEGAFWDGEGNCVYRERIIDSVYYMQDRGKMGLDTHIPYNG